MAQAVMAKRAKKQAHECPVCSRSFKNAGGLASHRRLAKDSLHVAARTTAKAAPAPTPSGPEKPTPEAPAAAPDEGPREAESAPVVEHVKPQQEEKAPISTPTGGVPVQEGGLQVVSFRPPQVVAPLSGTPQQEAPKEGGKNPPPSMTVNDVPLEPFIAGSVANVCNAFLLDPKKGDGQVSRQEVADTGFPKALEVSVRKYYPNLPLDHPFVLCAVSGAGLASLVKSKRAARGEESEEPEAPKREARKASKEPEPEPEPEPETRGSSPEGSAWAAMLAAGGDDE